MSGATTGRPFLFVFGLGYTGSRLARAARAGGWRAGGTVRSVDRRDDLRRDGFETAVFTGEAPSDEAADLLAEATHVVVSAPPTAEGCPVLRHHAADLRRAGGIAWVGYLGTTAVYGDRGGAWVSEADPVTPTTDRARRRVAAEGAWLASGLPAHVFRLAGIYGPGRNPLEQALAGTARRIVKPGQVFSRVHVDDIVRTLRASMARPNPGAVYNVCDDEPAPPQDVVAHACDLLGLPAPPDLPYATAELSPMARSFYLDNRRVDNARIKAELGVELAYPDYRAGLAALAAGLRRPAP